MTNAGLAEAAQTSDLLRPLRWWPGQPLPAAAPAGLAPTLLLLDRRRPPGPSGLAPLAALLDPEERARLERLRLQEDRHRALLARGALRLLLGAWLGRDPAALTFRYGPHGKPELAEPGGPHFNVSHAGDLILLAFHPRRAVGVDVERARPDLDWRPIARRMFAAADLTALAALPEQERSGGFLQCWCRLEARLKASGAGLAGAESLHRAEGADWNAALWDVAVPPGYRAAAALAPIRAHPEAGAAGGHPSRPG